MTDRDDERLLQRFGQWLRDTRAAAEELGCNGSPVSFPSVEEDIGLLRLVEEFTALRHEIKLQTKSSRTLEEQAEALVDSLSTAVEALRSVEPKEAQAAFTAGKALATALAESDEALDRGWEHTERSISRWIEDSKQAILLRLNEVHVSQSWVGRWIHADYYRRIRESIEKEQQRPERWELFQAILDGYRLVVKRFKQALTAENIVRIPTVGCPVDPEKMTVVEVVSSNEGSPGTVCDEVRRGYTWRGRVLRFAEVRAFRMPPDHNADN